MTPMSEVILRQKSQLTGKILLINPPQDGLCHELDGDVDIWTWNYADYQYFKTVGKVSEILFSVEFYQPHDYNYIIIFNPKIKQQLHYVLHQLSAKCALNSVIWLVGEKKAGIEGSAKLLKDYGKSSKIDIARHCQLWQLFLQKQEPLLPLSHWVKSYDLICNERTLSIKSLAGVFSQNKLDIGTAELLPFLTQIQGKKIADFGCGAGVIACHLAIYNPQAKIMAYDVDAFALASIALTIEHNQLTNIEYQAVTGVDDIDRDFDVIVSNPPFHQGVETSYDVSEQLCHQAKKHLNAQGQVWLVANRFLNYPSLLAQHFARVDIVHDANGFKVIKAS